MPKFKGYSFIKVRDLKTDMIAPMLHNGSSRDLGQLRAVKNLDSRIYVPYETKETDTTRSVSIGGNTNRIYGVENDILIVKESDSLDDLDVVFKTYEDVEVGDMLPIKLKGLSGDQNLWVEVFEKKPSHRTLLAKVGVNYITVDFYKQEAGICILVDKEARLDTCVKAHIEYLGK